MTALQSWFVALSRREQILIGVLALLLALTALFYGVVRPLWQGSWDAEAAYKDSAYRAARITGRLDLLASAPALSPVAVTAPLSTQIGAEAAERGFTLESNIASGNDGTSITATGVNPTALMQWLLVLEQDGVIVQQLSMQPVGGALSGASGSATTISVRADLIRLRP